MIIKFIRNLVISSLLEEIRTEIRPNKNRFPLYANRKRRIKKRDGNKCVKCNSTNKLSIDHIKPRAEGGMNDDNNLQTLCSKCHDKKTKVDNRRLRLLN